MRACSANGGASCTLASSLQSKRSIAIESVNIPSGWLITRCAVG